jgi:hypothetical protein
MALRYKGAEVRDGMVIRWRSRRWTSSGALRLRKASGQSLKSAMAGW